MAASRRRDYVRSISEATVKKEVHDSSISSLVHKGLETCWGEELFFDVEIFTNDGSVKAHKIVLASVSPFFKAVFSPQHQAGFEPKNDVDLRHITSNAVMKLVLQYAYTGRVELLGKNAQDLILLANYLQLHTLEKICAEFFVENLDDSNNLEILRFAKQAGILELINSCHKYTLQNFGKLFLDSDILLQMTTEELESFVRDDNLCITDKSGHIPPPSMQEKLLFLMILRYFQNHQDMLGEMEELLKNVRFHLICKYGLDSLKQTIAELEDKKLAGKCLIVLEENAALQPKPLGELMEAGKTLPRQCRGMRPWKSVRLAKGYISATTGFTDAVEGFPHYLKGMKLWIRRWDGRPVLGAMECLYSDGSKRFHGERSNYEVYEFALDEDEYVMKVVASSGYMVDNLTFITNKGTSYGPYGGDGGGERILKPPREHAYLSYVSGCEADTQGSLGIVSLSFHWIYYDLSYHAPEWEEFDPDRQITPIGGVELENINDSDSEYDLAIDDIDDDILSD